MFSPQREKTTNEVLNMTSLSKKTYSLSHPSLFGIYPEKSRAHIFILNLSIGNLELIGKITYVISQG